MEVRKLIVPLTKRYHMLTISDKELISTWVAGDDDWLGLNAREMAAWREKRRRANIKLGGTAEPDLITVPNNINFPFWLTMQKDFSFKAEDKYLFYSPLRNILWRFIDFFIGNTLSAPFQMLEPLRYSPVLSWYYGDDIYGETHNYVTRLIDKFDSAYVIWEVLLGYDLRCILYKIYKPFAFIIILPLLIFIRLTLPENISIRELFKVLILPPQKLNITQLETVTLSDVTEDLLYNADLLKEIESYKAINKVSYINFLFKTANKLKANINFLATDTLEGLLLGVFTEYRQGYYVSEDQIKHIFADDAFYGQEYLGFPWLSFGQRRFALDVVFIPLCLISLTTIGLTLYLYQDESLTWEWDPSKGKNIFVDNEEDKIKHKGHKVYESSMEGWFTSNLKVNVGPRFHNTLHELHDFYTWYAKNSDKKGHSPTSSHLM